jgi:CubicO group peptidase (beta-lactamase class C family)/peptidoglycan/LPS O-acetylase OafA/YrhL
MLWHATGAPWLTLITAVPVMFYINGKFTGGRDPQWVNYLTRRLRRLLVPLAVYSAVSIAIITVIARWRGFGGIQVRDVLPWFIPFTNPQAPAWTSGWFTEPLWYLRALLWFTLLTPVIRIVARGWVKRSPVRVVLPSLLAVSAFLLDLSVGSAHWQLQDLLMYGAFFTAGMLGSLENLSRAALTRIAGLCVAAAGALVVVRGIPAESVVNNSHSLHMLLGGAWLCMLLAFLPSVERLSSRMSVSRWVRHTSTRSLSLYLWHSPLFAASWIATRSVWSTIGFESSGLGGVALGAVAVGAGLYLSWQVSAGMSRIEQAAAGRDWSKAPQLTLRSLCALTTVLALAGLHHGPVQLPPPPSKGPTTFQADGNYAAPVGTVVDDDIADGSITDEVDSDSFTTENATPVDAAMPRTSGNAARHEDPMNLAPSTTQEAAYTTPTLRRVGSWSDLARPVSDEYELDLSGIVEQWTERYKIPGIAIAVLDTEAGRWATSSGVGPDGSSLQLGDALRYTSLTKSFTAALILEQVAAGSISLTDPVGILPQAPWFTLASDITVGELLSHRSGLINYTETDEYKKNWRGINSWESALRAVQTAGPQFPHGTKQAYSSTNYIVAGLLAERLYGDRVEDLITQRILQPLGLGSTRVGGPGDGSPGSGTGNMTGTITDAARWAVAMWRDAAVLSPQAQHLAVGFGSTETLGYGTWRYCPCVNSGGVVKPSGIGADGGELTVRWYQRTNTVIAVYVTEGIHLNDERAAQVEELISNLKAVL